MATLTIEGDLQQDAALAISSGNVVIAGNWNYGAAVTGSEVHMEIAGNITRTKTGVITLDDASTMQLTGNAKQTVSYATMGNLLIENPEGVSITGDMKVTDTLETNGYPVSGRLTFTGTNICLLYTSPSPRD